MLAKRPAASVGARRVEPMIEWAVAGHARGGSGYQAGSTMRGGGPLLRWAGQTEAPGLVAHRFETECGHTCEARYQLIDHAQVVRATTSVRNHADVPLPLEMLTSFAISGISPFARDHAPGRLRVHRFRSKWSAEGRLVSEPVEQLALERSWGDWGMFAERFGQVGSMPAKDWMPWVAVEDLDAGVVWAAALEVMGSWQFELVRRDDQLLLSGGLADREFGHWLKRIEPGETFTTPSALVTVVQGTLDEALHRLTLAQRDSAPDPNQSIEIVFNDWCAEWGDVNEETLALNAESCADLGIDVCVMDDGWFVRDDALGKGDWVENTERFPNGIASAFAGVRGLGVRPGIWFEAETVDAASSLAGDQEIVLYRDGAPLNVGERTLFLDLRSPKARAVYRSRVIEQLATFGAGYIKIDYNETIGLGADDACSPGEALRGHLDHLAALLEEMREALPNLTIEICSSGGMRLTPWFTRFADTLSVSDAHESVELPIIAANVHQLIPPEKAQVWAVLHPDQPPSRHRYCIAAGFLGQLCLSGPVHTLRDDQESELRSAIGLYRSCAGVIRAGRSHRFGPSVVSYRNPSGWQVVARTCEALGQTLIVAHRFTRTDEPISFTLPTGADLRVLGRVADRSVELEPAGGPVWTIRGLGELDACVFHVEHTD